MKFSKTFAVRGNMDRAFDLSEKYVLGMKFKIKNEVKPSLMVLDRGSGIGSTLGTKIEDCRTILTITFRQVKDEVMVNCDYDITVYGIVTSSDKTTLEVEVDKFYNFLVVGLAS